MIGIDHEPSRAILDALNEALGEGAYSIAYLDGQHGVEGIIRTREQPQREFKTRFARGQGPEQVEAIWQELVARTTAELKHEREQDEARARDYRPEPSPANEVKPGESMPHELTDAELADHVAAQHEPEPEGTTYDDGHAVSDAERSSDDRNHRDRR